MLLAQSVCARSCGRMIMLENAAFLSLQIEANALEMGRKSPDLCFHPCFVLSASLPPCCSLRGAYAAIGIILCNIRAACAVERGDEGGKWPPAPPLPAPHSSVSLIKLCSAQKAQEMEETERDP